MAEYFTPDTLLDDTLDELAQAREMVRFLTRANEALTAQLESTLKDRAQIIAHRDRLIEALTEIKASAAPDYWVPQYQHCVDVANAASEAAKIDDFNQSQIQMFINSRKGKQP
jgi:hypothetical protein